MRPDFTTSQALQAAEAYERFFVPAIGRPVAECLVGAAGLRPGERVLDVGCGTGIAARLACAEVGTGGSVAGVDVNPAMLAVAGAATPAEAAVAWHQGSAEALPEPDDAFDVVLCQMSLQFFADRVQALREMRRVLAPGGRALSILPGPMTPVFGVLAGALDRHLGTRAGGFVRQVFSLYEPDEIRDLHGRAGFQTAEVRRECVHLALPGAEELLEHYVASTPLAGLWATVEEPRRSAVRSEVLDAWLPLEAEGGLPGEQPMALAVAS